jgi:formylglycine-generating enzyme required for sulfatase activity
MATYVIEGPGAPGARSSAGPTSPCPTENALAAFVAGRLSADALAEVTCHLDECALCARLLPVLVTSRGGEARDEGAPRPERVDEYRLLEPLGRGAMGQVYRAHDERLDRAVAIKFVLGSDATAQERFANEARAIARLSHPNVVAIYRVGEHEGWPYLVSEFVRGTGLERLPRPVSWQQALRIATDLARGLAAAHRRGVLHRDIKPANAILADDGTVKLLDFGLAKLLEAPLASGARAPAKGEGLSLTQTGALVGTPLYLAPELWCGAPATAAADVYALGALLFDLCAGRPPHVAQSLRELRAAVATTAPELRAVVPATDAAFSAIVARCLAVDPAARYPSGEALLSALEELRPARQRLATAAAEWVRLGRPRELLWGRAQTAELAEFADEAAALRLGDLGPAEAAFLRASRAAQGRRRLGLRLALAALVASPGLLYGAARLQARREIGAQAAARIDEAKGTLRPVRDLDRQQGDALRGARQAFAQRRRAEGEASWQQALALLPAVERRYLEGRLLLEAALQLDREHPAARALYRETLLDAAAFAERNERLAERDELLSRLAVFDPTTRASWREDASLRLDVEPPGAQVAVSRYEPEGLRLEPRPVATPRAPAGASLRLPPGSYLLELSAEGRAPLRHPVRLVRGEDLALRLTLPPAESVPEGFVYIAAGRFLFGDASEESRLNFLDTTPMHVATTGNYLIARRETTFGEYLAFVRSLPAAERERYLPNSGGVGHFDEGMRVEARPGGFHYRFQRGGLVLDAGEGERVVYPSRSRHREQDWRRFPVGGITFAAASAYAAWLDRTGRVPGARLCDDHEWERAARGADGRLYATGDGFEAADANVDRTYDQVPENFGPDEVGSHPRSASPFLIEDTIGNALEWTSSSFSPTEHVGRGGSYYHDFRSARSTNRFTPEAGYRDAIIGLRVCAGR